MPRVVKFVFWRSARISTSITLPAGMTDAIGDRILLFYILSILLMGLNGMSLLYYAATGSSFASSR